MDFQGLDTPEAARERERVAAGELPRAGARGKVHGNQGYCASKKIDNLYRLTSVLILSGLVSIHFFPAKSLGLKPDQIIPVALVRVPFPRKGSVSVGSPGLRRSKV